MKKLSLWIISIFLTVVLIASGSLYAARGGWHGGGSWHGGGWHGGGWHGGWRGGGWHRGVGWHGGWHRGWGGWYHGWRGWRGDAGSSQYIFLIPGHSYSADWIPTTRKS